MTVIYSAAFLDYDSHKELLRRYPPVHGRVFGHHMTLAFRPSEEELARTPVGEPVTLLVVGYAVDDVGQAVVVQSSLQSRNSIPHITISCASTPVYSNKLLAHGYEAIGPFELKARVGLFVDGKPKFEL